MTDKEVPNEGWLKPALEKAGKAASEMPRWMRREPSPLIPDDAQSLAGDMTLADLITMIDMVENHTDAIDLADRIWPLIRTTGDAQSVRMAAIEECAKVCDDLRHNDYSAETSEWSGGTFDCARAIRALASQLSPVATVENKKGDQIHWLKVNDEPFEYAIQQGPHGDEFVKLLNGECLRRPLCRSSAGNEAAKACNSYLDRALEAEAKVKSLENIVDLLESNARVQAKLLADTGRERDQLRALPQGAGK